MPVKKPAAKPSPRGASRKAPSRKSSGAVPGGKFQAFLIGFIVGVVTMLLIPPLQDRMAQQQTEVKVTTPNNNKPDVETAARPSFDFYNMLKESEVIVPETEPAKTLSKPNNQSQPDYIYLLQVASFKSAEDAEAYRVQLLLMDLTASVETASLRPGEVRHRVLVGPFTDNAKLSAARTRLAENNIESLLLKREN